MNPFSPHFYYEKINKNLQIFDSSGKEIVLINRKGNKSESSISYTFQNFKDEFNTFDCLHELVFEVILGTLMESFDILIFNSVPLRQYDFMRIFQSFKNTYEDLINISDIRLDSQDFISQLVIQIKNIENTHYNQQAYLRNFSSNKEDWEPNRKKSKARVFVYNKKKTTIHKIGDTVIENTKGLKIESIAKKERFYSLPVEQLMRKTLEKDTPLILEKIIKFKSIRLLSNKEREVLAKYIVLTWNRTLEYRERLKESTNKFLNLYVKDFTDIKPINDQIIEITKFALRRQHELQMLEPFKSIKNFDIISHVLNFEWRLIKARTPNYFLTSDNPVVFYNSYYQHQKRLGNDYINKEINRFREIANFSKGSMYEFYSPYPERAHRQKGVEIYFPISPKLCICLYDKQDNIKPLILKRINKEIVLQANKFIFSHKKDFQFVKKILKNNPELKDRKGKRAIVNPLKSRSLL